MGRKRVRGEYSSQLYRLNLLEVWEAMEDVETRFLSLHEALNNNVLPLYKAGVLLRKKSLSQHIKERKKTEEYTRESKRNYFWECVTTRNCSKGSL